MELTKSAIQRIFDPKASYDEKRDALSVARSMALKNNSSTAVFKDSLSVAKAMTAKYPTIKKSIKFIADIICTI